MLNPIFLERMKEYLHDEYNDFYESFFKPNVRALRVNNHYIQTSNFKEIFDYEIKEIPYIKNGFYLFEELKAGFHPLHHAGAFYMQDPSAMIPANAILLPDNAFVLDLCSAPGGKATEIATKIPNGCLIANEIDYKRSKILASNVERLGFRNVVVTNNKAEDFLKNFECCFDAIFIDAPCSGEGMFRKYPKGQELWSLEEVNICAARDKNIIDNAYKLLKKDGKLIYSTCTFSKEENEDIISYISNKYDVEILPIDLSLSSVMKKGFIDNTYRFYPHISLGEGQFLAVIKKNDGMVKSPKLAKFTSNIKEFSDFKTKYLNKDIFNLIKRNNTLFYQSTEFDLSTLNVVNYGVMLGEILKGRFVPNHQIFKAFNKLFKNYIDLDFKDINIYKYLRGEQISFPVNDGYGVVFINGIALGGFKANNNFLNNLYPKGLRNF